MYESFSVMKDNDYLDSLQNEDNHKQIKISILELIASNKRREATEKIVKKLKAAKTFFTIRSDSKEEVWMYNEGIYIPNGKSYIKEYCRFILGEAFTTHIFNEVVAKISADTFIEIDDFFNDSPKDKIPVLNGVLNLRSGCLEEFSPSYFFFVKINAKFDSSKDCPNIKKFFNTLLKPEDVPAMQELFGYCLWKDNFTETSFLFRADGSNGKSKTMELLKAFVSPENCVSIPLKQLEGVNNFNVIELHNKLVNIAGEISKSALKETQMFKMLTGRDPVTANRKFLSPLSFVNYAKFIFSGNERPITEDLSDGFFRRWVVFYFKNKFVDSDVYESLVNKEGYAVKDPDIIEKIKSEDEFSGLLNWAVEGLHRLLKNKKFTNTKSTEETREDWIRDSNSFVPFFEKCMCFDRGTVVSKSELKSVYVNYCESFGLEPTSNYVIAKYLSSKGISTKRKLRKMQHGDEREYCWCGVRFKEDSVDALGWSIYTGDIE